MGDLFFGAPPPEAIADSSGESQGDSAGQPGVGGGSPGQSDGSSGEGQTSESQSPVVVSQTSGGGSVQPRSRGSSSLALAGALKTDESWSFKADANGDLSNNASAEDGEESSHGPLSGIISIFQVILNRLSNMFSNFLASLRQYINPLVAQAAPQVE